MDAVVETIGLTKRYRSVKALDNCDVALPLGKVTGLVGPNGAGKTTLIHLAVGLLRPTAGSIAVFGHDSTRDILKILPRVGFVAQDRPLYGDLTVAETLELGRRLNARWDAAYALARVQRFGLPLSRRIRTLSTGQRAHVATSIALGKRPELLLLDEPVANLDPVARIALLEELMSVVAEDGLTVVFSANALADVERVCEHIVILVNGRPRLTGDTEELIDSHVVAIGPRSKGVSALDGELIEARHAERQTIRLLRGPGPSRLDDGTVVRPATLEEIVLGYMRPATEVAA
jgi:ABC-2 type transport system ATP-binding protein